MVVLKYLVGLQVTQTDMSLSSGTASIRGYWKTECKQAQGAKSKLEVMSCDT